jgi:hypothetical protein
MMTKLHFIHEWKVIVEKNRALPSDRVSYDGNNDFRIRSDALTSLTSYTTYSPQYNIQILRCWKCDKIKHQILDTKGHNHTKELELWVAKELVGIGPKNDKTTLPS